MNEIYLLINRHSVAFCRKAYRNALNTKKIDDRNKILSEYFLFECKQGDIKLYYEQLEKMDRIFLQQAPALFNVICFKILFETVDNL